MTSRLKIIIFCILSLLLLVQVESRGHHKERRSDENKEALASARAFQGRGVIGNIINTIRDSSDQVQRQEEQINLMPPNISPENAVEPTIQPPSNFVQQTQKRPILNALLSNLRSSIEIENPEQPQTQKRPILNALLSNLRSSIEIENPEQPQTQKRPILNALLSNLRSSIEIEDPEQPQTQKRPILGALLSNLRNSKENEVQQQTQNRPSIIGGLFSNIMNSKEKIQAKNFYNKAWLDYAMQLCGRIEPTSLTAILPTSTNGLRQPKMYYFQNDTTGGLSWSEAQQWCTSRGMNLLTVNDENENKIIIERLREIMAGNIPATINPAGPGNIPPASINPNPNAFWIGLNSLNDANNPVWIGDGTSKFIDFFPLEPTPEKYCGTYNQVTTINNIHMDAVNCLDSPAQKLRFICEVSDECTALFMSRFPTSYFHQG